MMNSKTDKLEFQITCDKEIKAITVSLPQKEKAEPSKRII